MFWHTLLMNQDDDFKHWPSGSNKKDLQILNELSQPVQPKFWVFYHPAELFHT